MTVDYRIDVERSLVVSWGVGTLTAEDIVDHRRRLLADARFSPEFNQLADFKGVTDLKLSAEDIRNLARDTLFSATSRRALVMEDRDSFFGLGRMYELLRSRGPEEIRVFRDYAEALAWLNLPADYSREVE